MTDPCRDRPTAAARDLVEQSNYAVPVDLDAIAARLGVEVRLEDLDDVVSGLLMLDRRRPLVAVNRAHHPNRRRFTIAHEIGHLVLHGERTKFFLDASPVFFRRDNAPRTNQTVEREANRFAAELLMPGRIMCRMVADEPIDIFDEADVRRLAERLQVSVQALTIRLTELDLVV